MAVLVIGFANAQIVKFKAADFKLSSDVSKYEEHEYYFEFGLNKYQLLNSRTIYLDKGLVSKIENKSNYFLYVEATNTFNYKDGMLLSIHTKTQMSEYTENFIYKNGKIVEKNKNDNTENKTVYEYDTRGNLSKETVYEKGAILKNITFSNYTSANSYDKKTIKYNNATIEETNEQIIKNGLLISEKNTTEYSTLNETYQHDKYGNVIVYTRDDKVYKNSYEYDANGNVLRSQKLQLNFDTLEDINYFSLARVTFANGKSVGNTDFDVNYVKKYDLNSPSYEVNNSLNGVSAEELTKAINDLQASISSHYLIMKNEVNTFTIKDPSGEEITDEVEAVKSKYDILVYDILLKKSVVFKNFYSDDVKIGEWYYMEELSSPTGLYWIFSDKPEFFIIQNGSLSDMSLYKLVKTQKEDEFIVQEAGIDKYIIRNLNSKVLNSFYPLEFLNN